MTASRARPVPASRARLKAKRPSSANAAGVAGVKPGRRGQRRLLAHGLDGATDGQASSSRPHPGNAQCVRCRATFARGRWTWNEPQPDAREVTCPACARIVGRNPAGHLRLGGAFLHRHRDDIERLIDHVATRERIEHPLNRLMETLPFDDGLDIATTDIHLPQRLGEALKHAYGGELDIRYAAGNRSVLVTWRRDA